MIVYRVLIDRPGMYISEFDCIEPTAQEKYDYNYERIFGMKGLRPGAVFREANVPVPIKYKEWAFEYRIGYDAGTRFKKYFPSPAFSNEEARNAFRSGWQAGRKLKKE
jgi:hypothetical protein